MKPFAFAILVSFFVSLSASGQNSPSRTSQIDQRIFDCRAKIQALERQKETALEELRQGLFCSKCDRSKSEIERAGEGFEAHLGRVHGQAVARPELITAKARFYDEQIAAFQRQIADLERMKGQMVDAARQQADLERQRQQREREQARLREMQAQQEKLRQERERIVNRAQAKAENYQRAGQSAANGIKQIGDVLVQQMQRDAERDQQRRDDARAEREQEQYDRQMADLDEKIHAQEQQVAQTGRDSSDSSGSLDLPPPVELREPPSEQDYARGTARRDDATERQLATMRGNASDRSMFDTSTPGDGARPFDPPQRLSDLLGGNQPSDASSKGTPPSGPEDGLTPQERSFKEWHQRAVQYVDVAEKTSKTEDAIAKLREGLPDVQGKVDEGLSDGFKSQAAGAAKMLDGAAEIGAQGLGPEGKAVYDAGHSLGEVSRYYLGQVPHEPLEKLGTAAAQNKTVLSPDQLGLFGKADPVLERFGKANDAFSAGVNAVKAEKDLANQQYWSATKNGVDAAKDASSVVGFNKLNQAASVFSGLAKMYDGATAIADGVTLRRDVAAQGQAFSRGLEDQIARKEAQLAQQQLELEKLREQLFGSP